MAPQKNPRNHFYSSLHDRMEIDRMEKEKRDREMAELRDRENSLRMRDEMMRRGALEMPRMASDPYLEASRRYAAVAGLSNPFGMGPGERLSAERLAAERMALSTDPLVRLQMAGISPEVSAHTHTHLHINPSDPAAAAFMLGQPPGMAFPPADGPAAGCFAAAAHVRERARFARSSWRSSSSGGGTVFSSSWPPFFATAAA